MPDRDLEQQVAEALNDWTWTQYEKQVFSDLPDAAKVVVEVCRKYYASPLAELIDAGEPFIHDAFPNEQMTGQGLRLYNRWLAAMNDARAALKGPSEQ